MLKVVPTRLKKCIIEHCGISWRYNIGTILNTPPHSIRFRNDRQLCFHVRQYCVDVTFLHTKENMFLKIQTQKKLDYFSVIFRSEVLLKDFLFVLHIWLDNQQFENVCPPKIFLRCHYFIIFFLNYWYLKVDTYRLLLGGIRWFKKRVVACINNNSQFFCR